MLLRRYVAVLLSGMLWFGSAAALASAPDCDPHRKALDQAKWLLSQKRFDEAQAGAQSVLDKDPEDFRAAYLKGLAVVDRADSIDIVKWTPRTEFPSGIALLVSTARRLGAVDQRCAKTENFYTILNTIGAEYLNRGHLPEAQRYLEQAYASKDMLNHDSYVKLLDNLGLVYLLQKRFDLSSKMYKESVTAGSKVAAYQLETVADLRPLLEPKKLAIRPTGKSKF